MIEVGQLKQMQPIQGISDNALNFLAGVLQKRSYQDKGPIFNEGTEGGDLYLVGQGAVRITKRAKEGEAQNLGVVPAGRFVGIMTFLSGGAHSADANAKGETVLYLLDKASFDRFVEEHPADAVIILRMIIDELVESLRGMNERYIDMVNYMWRWR